jgi:DNA repair protein RadC
MDMDTLARSTPPGKLAIRELASADRPLYRIAHHGPLTLSEAELIALITGTRDLGAAYQLLAEVGGIYGLFTTSPAALTGKVKGIGKVGVARINAAFELSRRLLLHPHEEKRAQIRSPADLSALLMREMGELDQEHLRVACLDSKNRVQAIPTIYIGSLNTAVVRVGELFKEALRLNSASIILAHNHPSGDATPSPEDVLVTRQAVDAGALLDVGVLDHLIITKGRFTSLRERGLGFSS